MSLAPTLQLERTISAGLGAIVIGGLIANTGVTIITPTAPYKNILFPLSHLYAGSAFNFGVPQAPFGLIPTVNVTLGPNAQPSQAAVSVAGLVPFLERIKIITAGLPDGTPSENTLTPTLVWGDSMAPTQGTITIGGQIPALLLDNSQTIYPSQGYASFGSLLPVVQQPAGQDGLTLPFRGTADVVGLAPTLTGEMPISVTLGGITITGLVPTLGSRGGWETVALSGAAIWVDVPNAI